MAAEIYAVCEYEEIENIYDLYAASVQILESVRGLFFYEKKLSGWERTAEKRDYVAEEQGKDFYGKWLYNAGFAGGFCQWKFLAFCICGFYN